MTTQVTAKPVTIEQLVAGLRDLPQAAFAGTAQVLALLQSSPVLPDSLAQFLCWDRQHYTRNLIDKTPLYELIAICWEIGQASSVHNHRDQNCWMTVPIGRLLVENYRTLSQDLDKGACHLEPSDIVEMNPSHP